MCVCLCLCAFVSSALSGVQCVGFQEPCVEEVVMVTQSAYAAVYTCKKQPVVLFITVSSLSLLLVASLECFFSLSAFFSAHLRLSDGSAYRFRTMQLGISKTLYPVIVQLIGMVSRSSVGWVASDPALPTSTYIWHRG